ncbi:hypothetical protein DFH06DRAFT_1426735 [Mycena polygramma]|nr:hypothetical protein DFH06DRAFT_1426735 [Mycena polygramma]
MNVPEPASSLEPAPPTSESMPRSDGVQLEDSESDSDSQTSGAISPISVDVFQEEDLPSDGDTSDDNWSLVPDPRDHDDLFFEFNRESTTQAELHAEVVLESHCLDVDQRTASVFRRMGERIDAIDEASLSNAPISARESVSPVISRKKYSGQTQAGCLILPSTAQEKRCGHRRIGL